ncbi:hypothetical protein [Aporhodopirellula aestuarii]|uniref:Uncharacterized protein n=1 Tax=Aporhodopirellula aestuarii TaxID=2950107 RepID=A0ABT0U5X7_9BACT|nr:hypothetical protein [Aporhodopirellula aestuarii]MCM2372337.1 hypothetical protein [Aporhodopirellula aestuarii]
MKPNINPYEPNDSSTDSDDLSAVATSASDSDQSTAHVLPAVIAGLIGYGTWIAADRYFEFSDPESWLVQGVSLATCALLVSLVFPLPPKRSRRWLQIISPSVQIMGLWGTASIVSAFTKAGVANLVWLVGLILLIYLESAAAKRSRKKNPGGNDEDRAVRR